MKPALVVASAVVLLLGLVTTPITAAGGRPERLPSIELTARTHAGCEVRGTQFSLRDVRDLRIVTWWSVRGAHVQRLELRAPGGAIYQRLSQPFDVTRAPGKPRRGRPHGTPVETLLPVGGTWITEHALAGEWLIDVYLDDARSPVTSASFVLDP